MLLWKWAMVQSTCYLECMFCMFKQRKTFTFQYLGIIAFRSIRSISLWETLAPHQRCSPLHATRNYALNSPRDQLVFTLIHWYMPQSFWHRSLNFWHASLQIGWGRGFDDVKSHLGNKNLQYMCLMSRQQVLFSSCPGKSGMVCLDNEDMNNK